MQNMRELIPEFISNKYLEGKRSGKLRAAVLFVDISGFTEMTKRLMDRGNEGIEILTLTINEIFSPAISEIRENGGFISVFGGDAFYSIFDSVDVNYLENALASAKKICSIFVETGVKDTKWGRFDLSVRAGISVGEIEWGIIENNNQNSYYFKGEPIDSSGKIQEFCPKNSVVVDREFKNRFQSDKYEEVEKGVYIPFNEPKPLKKRQGISSPNKDVMDKFFPKRLMDESLRGEFREVVSVFLSFRESSGINEKISDTIDLVLETGGYFNRVSYGDKGGFILAFYGAPEGRERLRERAVKMVLAASKIPDFMICAGITFGMAFSGFSGSQERAEYTCQGEKVNLAARLMAFKDQDLPPEPRIFVEHSLAMKLKNLYDFELFKKANMKGFEKPMEIYSLIGEKKSVKRGKRDGDFVGRRKQLETTMEIFEKTILSKRFGGLLKIEGEAGVGKSYFVSELAESTPPMQWIFMTCDQIYRYSLNPIQQFIEDYFNLGNVLDDEEKALKLKRGIEEVFEGGEYLDESERERMIYLFMDLLGVKISASPYEQLSSKNKKDEIFYFLKTFIKRLSKKKPLGVLIDDIHWMDEDTSDFIKFLTAGVEEFPFIIVAASRPQMEKEEISPFKRLENFHTIRLEPFDKEDSFDMMRKFTGNENIPFTTMEFVQEKSEGNPFYIKQILSYLIENEMIDAEYRLTSKSVFIPSDIRSLLVARFDSFEETLRKVAVRASVIGREFHVNILEKMTGSRNLEKALEDGVKNGIWGAAKPGFYVFSHALIRDSIYDMQLLSERKKLHLEAAKSFERLNIDDHYTAFIAHHYDLAEDEKNAPLYLRRALKISENNMSVSDTLKFYEALEKYLPIGREKVKNKIKKTNLLLKTGNSTLAEKTAELALEESEKNGWEDIKADSLLALSSIAQNRGKLQDTFSYLKRLESMESISSETVLQGRIRQSLGSYYAGINDEKAALEYFNKSLRYFEKANDKINQAHTLSIIAIFCGRAEEIGLSNVLKILFQALEIAEEIKNPYLIENIYFNIALSYTQIYCDMEKSLEYYKKNLEISKRLGNKSGEMYVYVNIGTVYLAMAEDIKAEEHFKKSLDLAIELGYKVPTYYALMNLASLYILSNKLEESLEYALRAEQTVKNDRFYQDLHLQILTIKFEIYCALKEPDLALKILEELDKLHREVFEGKGLEDFCFKEQLVSYIKSPDKVNIKNLMELAEGVESPVKRADAFYAIWETTKALDAAQKALDMFIGLIQAPPEQIQEFKDPFDVIKKNRLESFIKTGQT